MNVHIYMNSNFRSKLWLSSASVVEAGHVVYPLLGPGAVDEVSHQLPRGELLTRGSVNGGNVVIIRIITQEHVKCAVNQRYAPVRLGLKIRINKK